VAQSQTIRERLRRFGGIESDVVYPPAPERPYRNDGYGDYVFAVSRLHPLKRIDLLVEAAARMRDRSLRFRIAGDGEARGEIEARIRNLGLESRVELLGAVDENELVRQYAGCRAVFFAPKAEDYGFVTLEAFRSGKPVVTTSDSGGPAELVRHDESGAVTDPDPSALAEQLDRLAADPGLAERLGSAALAQSLTHTWSGAVSGIM
jgi:glycosyltransferase involved in cell wall biosynthesis